MLATPDDNIREPGPNHSSFLHQRINPVDRGFLATSEPNAAGASQVHPLSSAALDSRSMNKHPQQSSKVTWTPPAEPFSITGMSAEDVIGLWCPGVAIKTLKEETRALLGREAIRWPILRMKYRGGVPNLTKDINVQALCVQIIGFVSERQCGHCSRGHGNFDRCIRLEGWTAMGACANCCFNNDPTRCNFHSKPKTGTL